MAACWSSAMPLHTIRAQISGQQGAGQAAGRFEQAAGRLTCLAGRVLLGNARVEACTRLLVAQLPVDADALVVTVPAYCAGAGPLRLVPALTRAIVLEAGVISAERAVGGGSGVSTEAVRACGAPCTAFWAYHATESKRRRSSATTRRRSPFHLTQVSLCPISVACRLLLLDAGLPFTRMKK